jgi:hypothetical protein
MERVKIEMRKMIYGVVIPRVKHPTLVEKASVKLYSKSDMVHMMLKLKYVLSLILNPKTYYLLHHFQIFLRVRITLLALRGHIIEKQFLIMWAIKDLEWRKFLVYNIVCCYI